jgi:hypothetical protein
MSGRGDPFERGNELVFPQPGQDKDENYAPGLTIREYAAIHLAAACPNLLGECTPVHVRRIVAFADLLIAELERTRK